MNNGTEVKQNIQEHGLEWYGRYYGVYRGFVDANDDPEFLGRLKVRVPQIYGEEVPEYWAWSKGMFAGNQIGLFAIPNIGDGVWVSFENGDPRFPIWEYGWFAEGEVPTEAKVDGNKPKNMIWKSTKGHKIEMDDHNDLVRITDKHGNIVELNETGVSIVSDKISLGSLDGSEQPAVLGDTAMDLLIEFMNDLGNLKTIVTSSGVTSSVNTAANWSALVSKWNTKWEEFKSQKVTLDKQ